MIRSSRDKEAAAIFVRQLSRRVPHNIQRAVYRKLLMIEAATDLQDLRVPFGNRLEALRGDRVGQHSIRINDQWRICFRWKGGNALDVEIVDYH